MGIVRETPTTTEYADSGYRVVVAKRDGAIKVKAGDSLSKYSKAIYGNFANMDQRFGRKVGGRVASFKALRANINLLNTGETVYYMMGYESRGGSKNEVSEIVVARPGGRPGARPIPRSELSQRTSRLLKYLKQVVMPESDWTLKASDGAGVGFGTPIVKLGGSLDVMRFWVQRDKDPKPMRLCAASIGGSGGIEADPIPVDVSFSHSCFKSYGCVLKGPTAGATLHPSEFGGGVVAIDLCASSFSAVSLTFLMGGPSITQWFTNPALNLTQVIMPKWMIVSLGYKKVTSVDVTCTVSLGYLWNI